jgi:hypothetical protein
MKMQISYTPVGGETLSYSDHDPMEEWQKVPDFRSSAIQAMKLISRE